MISTYTGLELDDSFSVSRYLLENDIEVLGISNWHRSRQFLLYVPKNVINYVVEGQKRMYFKKRLISMKKGDLMFIPAGSYIFSDVTRSPSSFKSANILLDERVFRIGEKGSNNGHRAQHSHLLKDLIARLHRLTRSEIELEEMLPVIERAMTKLPVQHESSEDEIRFKTIVNLCLGDSRTLPEFAGECNMSLATFKRHFTAAFGTAPKQWVREKKLEIADFLLKTHKLSVTDVCFKAGFEDVSHFIQLYRKQFGVTPKQSSLQTSNHM